MSKAGIRISSELGFGESKVTVFNTEMFQEEANFALALVERWGMVQGADGGEDSQGRAKLRLMTPDEVVERAFACALSAYAKARELGLSFPVPDLNEINTEYDAKHTSKRKEREPA